MINICPAVITGLNAVPGIVVLPDTVYCYSKEQCQHHRSYVCVKQMESGQGGVLLPFHLTEGSSEELKCFDFLNPSLGGHLFIADI